MTHRVTNFNPMQGEDDELVVRFAGPALDTLRELSVALNLPDENAVVTKAIELLLSTRDKEVLLRDGRRTEVIRLWPSS